jgi:hypothetical protein
VQRRLGAFTAVNAVFVGDMYKCHFVLLSGCSGWLPLPRYRTASNSAVIESQTRILVMPLLIRLAEGIFIVSRMKDAIGIGCNTKTSQFSDRVFRPARAHNNNHKQVIHKSRLVHVIIRCSCCFLHESSSTKYPRPRHNRVSCKWRIVTRFPRSPHYPPRLTYVREHARCA